MSRISRPSPAIIVAVVALVAALAGTAVAGPGATTSKITKKKVATIADNEINKLAPGLSVAKADTATTVADGAIRAADLGPITTVSSTSGSFGPGVTGGTFIQCPEGTALISGGVGEASAAKVYTTLSRKSSPNGWRVDAFNDSAVSATITAYANCLEA